MENLHGYISEKELTKWLTMDKTCKKHKCKISYIFIVRNVILAKTIMIFIFEETDLIIMSGF